MDTKDVDLQVILNNSKAQAIINILFGISTASLTMILIDQEFAENYIYVLLPLLSFIIAEIITFKFKFLKNIFQNVKMYLLITSTILGTFATYNIITRMSYIILVEEMRVFFLLAIPATIIFLYWFYDKFVFYMKKYILSLDKIEKYYLLIGILILIIGITCIYNMTSIFHNITINEENSPCIIKSNADSQEENERMIQLYSGDVYELLKYDILYTSDTASLLAQDVYTQVAAYQNDIKQPLFGVFSVPFHIIPRMISDILPGIQNLYAILVAIIQGSLILIAFTLLSRLMKIKGCAKVFFLVALSITYPTLLFLLNLEQYLISVFYMIVFIYFAFNHIKEKDMAYIGATGSMLTSGILFPLLGKRKNIKRTIKNVFFTFFKCIIVLIISARIVLVFPKAIKEQIGGIKQFSNSENYTIVDKWNMYTNFLKNTVYFSEFETYEHSAGKTIKTAKTDNKKTVSIIMASCLSIRQINTTKFNMVGAVIAFLTFLGFILNRKDRFSQIAFTWCIFSFILLFLMGWGINEDGLLLYTFYFSWAFICLIFKLIEKLLHRHKKIKIAIYGMGILSMMIINFYGIYQTILFGIQYFKC